MLTQSSKEEPCVKKKRKWIRWVVLLLLAALLLGLVTGGMIRWIRTRGARIYAEL